MTRTARRGKKKEPLPATPWEKLSGEHSNQKRSENGDIARENDDLKVTQKRKLGPKVTKKAKTKLKRLTGKASSNGTFGDHVTLIDQTEPSESLSESANGSESRLKSKKKLTGQSQGSVRTSESSKKPLTRGKKRKSERLLKKLGKKKRRKGVSEDRVHLLRHSDSDSSLSDQGEMGSGGESGSGECEAGDSGKLGGDSGGGPGVEFREEDEGGKDVKSMKKGKNVYSRIKKGNRWVKASNSQPLVEEGGDGTGEEVDGIGSTMKRKRPMDEESRRKRIEHRKLRRQRNKVCFNCRQPGHWLGDCPLAPSSSAGVCFKCGSSEHTCQQCHTKVPSGEFPYAKCFICGEIGHLTRSCPDNPRGLYPRGGGCKICGSVEHLKANCPDGNKSTKVTTSAATSEARGGGVSAVSLSADALDNEGSPPVRKRQKTGGKRAKIVKF